MLTFRLSSYYLLLTFRLSSYYLLLTFRLSSYYLLLTFRLSSYYLLLTFRLSSYYLLRTFRTVYYLLNSKLSKHCCQPAENSAKQPKIGRKIKRLAGKIGGRTAGYFSQQFRIRNMPQSIRKLLSSSHFIVIWHKVYDGFICYWTILNSDSAGKIRSAKKSTWHKKIYMKEY
jgi:hypothetical protein